MIVATVQGPPPPPPPSSSPPPPPLLPPLFCQAPLRYEMSFLSVARNRCRRSRGILFDRIFAVIEMEVVDSFSFLYSPRSPLCFRNSRSESKGEEGFVDYQIFRFFFYSFELWIFVLNFGLVFKVAGSNEID